MLILQRIFNTLNKIGMWVLLGLLVAGAAVLGLLTYFNRKKSNEEIDIKIEMDEDCCGAHTVCDRDTLLNSDTEIVYYDDEELDVLALKNPNELSAEQAKQLADVFYSLRESDVAGWLRSLQLRKICLPQSLKDEALLIVSERRNAS